MDRLKILQRVYRARRRAEPGWNLQSLKIMEKIEATQFLRDHHKTLLGLFRQFENIGARAPELAQGVIGEIVMQLEIYSTLESEIWYPRLNELASGEDSELRSLIGQGESELRDLTPLLASLKGYRPEGAEFRALYDELVGNAENLFTFEETELFPYVGKILKDPSHHGGGGAHQHGIAQQLEQRRKELFALPQYRTVLPEVVQNPNGGEQMRTTRGAA